MIQCQSSKPLDDGTLWSRFAWMIDQFWPSSNSASRCARTKVTGVVLFVLVSKGLGWDDKWDDNGMLLVWDQTAEQNLRWLDDVRVALDRTVANIET